MTGSPPYLVMARRAQKQHGLDWVTDSRHNDLDLAVAAAKHLRETFGRDVRVVDQEERVWYSDPQMGQRRKASS